MAISLSSNGHWGVPNIVFRCFLCHDWSNILMEAQLGQHRPARSTTMIPGSLSKTNERFDPKYSTWLVVWNLNFMTFHSVGNNNPNWRTHIFQRGRSTTNQTHMSSIFTIMKSHMYIIDIHGLDMIFCVLQHFAYHKMCVHFFIH